MVKAPKFTKVNFGLYGCIYNSRAFTIGNVCMFTTVNGGAGGRGLLNLILFSSFSYVFSDGNAAKCQEIRKTLNNLRQLFSRRTFAPRSMKSAIKTNKQMRLIFLTLSEVDVLLKVCPEMKGSVELDPKGTREMLGVIVNCETLNTVMRGVVKVYGTHEVVLLRQERFTYESICRYFCNALIPQNGDESTRI